MRELSPASRASRRELVVALFAFILGFAGTLTTLAWLIVRFVTPEARWWDILHMSINAILISVVFGGLGAATLSIWATSRYHYWRGFYRCPFCDSPLKGVRIPCACRGKQMTSRAR